MRKFLAAMGLALTLAGCAAAPSAETPAPDGMIAPTALRADFAALYEGLQRAHFDLFANTPRAAYDRLYRDMAAELTEPMTPLEARVYFQRFAAASQVAQARLDFPGAEFGAFREAGGRIFPLVVRIDDGRIFVEQNLSGVTAIAVGDEITAINGARASVWLQRLRAHVSADTDYLAYSQIDQMFGALLWLELGEIERFDVRVRDEIIAIPARNRIDMRAAAAEAPPSLEIDPTERVARMLPDGVAYLRPGIFMNYPGDDPYDTAAFRAFIDDAFARFLDADATTLLIDLRDNPGGDNSFSDHMIAWFADEPFRFTSDFRIRVSPETTASNAARLTPDDAADSIGRRFAALYAGAQTGDIARFEIPMAHPREGARFNGRVFALINRRSFSNSVNTAAIIQDYGFGTILGEPTSDLATTYGAMEHFILPNTGFSVGYPKAYILRPNGDTRVAGVTPDVAIATPIVQSADDPVLQEALRIAAQR